MAVEIQAKMKPKNNNNFALIDACDVAIGEGDDRLDKYLANLQTGSSNIKDSTEAGGIQVGENIKIVGSEKNTDASRVEVNRKLDGYTASSRQFATYDYNSFIETNKRSGISKPLRGCTLLFSAPQYDAYFNNNKVADTLLNSYNADKSYWYDDGDTLRKDVIIKYPFKNGEVAVIEPGGVLKADYFGGYLHPTGKYKTSVVDVGTVKTGWLMFGDNADQENNNKMHMNQWVLNSLTQVSMPYAQITASSVKISNAPKSGTDAVRKQDISKLEKLINGLSEAQISALNNFARSLTVEE
jgi:hypothetical protein